jgi:hypothetical protein
MQQLLLSETLAARRRIPLFLFDDDSADSYAPKTSQTFIAAEIRVSKNGAAEVDSAGTVVEVAGGGYYYQATQAELDTLGYLSIRPNKTDVYGSPSVVQVIALNLYDAAAAGITNLDATVSSRLPTSTYEGADAILDKANGVYTGFTLRQAIRAISAILHGKVSGARTGREVFRSINDDSDAVTVTNDSAGNRTAVVRNV